MTQAAVQGDRILTIRAAAHPVLEGAQVKWPGVSVVDRGELEASCSEWHADGTAGEDDRASHLAAVVPARAMGEASPG